MHALHSPTPSLAPSAAELLDEQYVEAVQRLHENTSQYPVFPWRALADLAGPMCPEDLIMVMARTGSGKSLFLQNLFDAMITAGRCGLYIGLEQPPRILRAKWACMRAGYDPRLLLATRPEERNTPNWREAMDKVQEELAWQKRKDIAELAMFAGVRTIDAAGLIWWTEWAVNLGADFIVLDHIDRVKHGEGKNPFHEMSETVRTAKELAVENRVIMLVASQVGRPGDAGEAFIPPALHQMRGGGTKEEESDTVLGLYRPLKANTTDADIKRVRQGLAGNDTITEPHQMGVRVLKHRLDGSAFSKACTLGVYHGRVTDLDERDKHGTSWQELNRL